MRPVRVLTVFLIAALLAAVPVPAIADGWRIASPLDSRADDSTDAAAELFYVAPDIGYRAQTLPRFHIGAVPYYSTRTTSDGPSGGVAFGSLLPGGLVRCRNARIELSLNVFDATAHDQRVFPSEIPGSWVPVGGGQPESTGGVKSVDLHTEVDGAEIALRLASDLPIVSGFTLTPAIAIFGGASDRRLRYSETAECSSGDCFEDWLNERVRTTEVGSTVSVGSRWTFADGLSVLLGAGASIAYTHSRLHAADCFDRVRGLRGCQILFRRDGTTAEAAHDALGYRLMGQLGLRYDLGSVTLDLLGDIRYASAVAAIENPSQANQVVRLSSSGQVGYTGRVQVTVPFGAVRRE